MLITYSFAILGMETIPPKIVIKDTAYDRMAVDSFGSMTFAMLTLMQCMTLDSVATIYRTLIQEADSTSGSMWNAMYFILFTLFVSIALMNLVVAVMVEGSQKQAAQDQEAMKIAEEQRKVALFPRLREIFDFLDKDKSGEVSLCELETAPAQILLELRIITRTDDILEMFMLFDDDDSGSVRIDEFLTNILRASSAVDVVQKLQIQRILRKIVHLTEQVEQLGKDCTSTGDGKDCTSTGLSTHGKNV